MPKTLPTFCGAVFALVSGALPAQTPTQPSQEMTLKQNLALDQAMALRSRWGLNGNHGFHAARAFTNPQGEAHVRLQQMYKGVKVLGGEVLMQFDGMARLHRTVDHTVKTGYEGLSVTPALTSEQVLQVATGELGASVPLAYAPKVELVIAKDDGKGPLLRNGAIPLGKPGLRLAYKVHTAVEAPRDLRSTDFLIDAQDGHILKSWDSLQTTAGKAKGKGFYNGDVTLDVDIAEDGTQRLHDTTRGKNPHPYLAFADPGGNLFMNLRHQWDLSAYGLGVSLWGEIYVNPPGSDWGDGTLYWDQWWMDGTDSPAALSVAADVAEGVAKTWDFHQQVLGWQGIDNQDSSLITRLHLNHQYPNAFWSDDCFCITFGDGQLPTYAPLTTMDIVGHEVSHGVTTYLGGLDYWGQSGGLNESMSDIFGKMVEVWSKSSGGLGTTIPEMGLGLSWNQGSVFFNQDADPSQYAPLRYMDHPSLDGHSADTWGPGMDEEDVHYTSGPMNRAFVFLSQGASSDPSVMGYSPYLQEGFQGIGNDKATKVMFKMRQSLPYYATYADARAEACNAALTLYGTAEETAVKNAFAAIDVGLRAASVQINRTTGDAADPRIGGSLDIGMSAAFTSSSSSTVWTLKEGVTAGTLTPDAAVPGSVTFKAGTVPGLYHIQATSGGQTTSFPITVFNGDVNGDQHVDIFDMGTLAYQCGSQDASAAMDLNGDGVVNAFDMDLLHTRLQ